MVPKELPEVSTDYLPDARYKTTGKSGKKEDSLCKEGTEFTWGNQQNWNWQSLKVTEKRQPLRSTEQTESKGWIR